MEDIAYLEDPENKDEPEAVGDSEPAVEDAVTPSETTANCDGDTFKYKKGKPIVSITFSLSEENPFEVNVGTSMTSYKKSDKKAYPVLCEIKDFTSGSVKREPLKNKGCIEKNLPKVLAPILTQLNSLLLDQYNAYYETKKYDDFVAAQSDFLKASTPKSGEKGEEGEEEGEEETPIVMEGQDPEKFKRAAAIKVLIDKLQKKSIGTIAGVGDPKLDPKLDDIKQKNGVDLPTLKAFLTKHAIAVFPLHLLPLAYGNQIIFMTNNGILTNGSIIFSYNNININDKKSTVTANVFNWTFINETDYKQALSIIDGEKEDDNYISKGLIEKGDFKGGRRKTLSQRFKKHRTIKRSRK